MNENDSIDIDFIELLDSSALMQLAPRTTLYV